MDKTEWILCPLCGSKTRNKVREDTVLINDPLYCPKCRQETAKLRKSSIELEAITLDNVYKIMQNFGKLYAIMSDEEKKSLIGYLIKEIQIYPSGESKMPLKSIEFNFPIYIDGKEVRKVLWERGNTVEAVCLLYKQGDEHDIELKLMVDRFNSDKE